MEDKEIDFLVGEYLRFWDELGIDDLNGRQPALRALAHDGLAQTFVDEAVAPAPPSLDQLRKQVGASCGNPRCARAHKIVFGAGNPRARLLFVGDLPGSEEDASGLPFVGADGQLLGKIIEAMGSTRDQVYLTYALRCEASEAEYARCAPILEAQIAAVQPACVVALGPRAAAMLSGGAFADQPARGQWLKLHCDPTIPLMPTLAPAHLLRHPADKKTVWEDLKKVKTRLEGAKA